jgi:hypothetical protein
LNIKKELEGLTAEVLSNLDETPEYYSKHNMIRSFIEKMTKDSNTDEMISKIFGTKSEPVHLSDGIVTEMFNYKVGESEMLSSLDSAKLSRTTKKSVCVHSYSGLSSVLYGLPTFSPGPTEGISPKFTENSIILLDSNDKIGKWSMKRDGLKEPVIHYMKIGGMYIPIGEIPKRRGNFLDTYYASFNFTLYKPLISQEPFDRDMVQRKNNLWKLVNSKIAKSVSAGPKLASSLTKLYSDLFEKEIMPSFIDAPVENPKLLIDECRRTFFRELRAVIRKIEKALPDTPKLSDIENTLNQFIKTDSGMFYSTALKAFVILAKKEY